MEINCARGVAVLEAALLVLLVGCGQGGRPAAIHTAAGDYRTIRALETFYSDYEAKHKGHPPKDEQAFREFLTSKQDDLAKEGLTVERVFVSPRNGENLAWVYGKPLPPSSSGTNYVAWETKSSDGKRLVIAAGGIYELMDAAKLHAAIPNAD